MSLRSSDSDHTATREGINKYFEIHKPVFWPSVLLILTMIVTTLVMGDRANAMFETVQAFISNNTGWFYSFF